jgi:hypothetical protein
LLQAPTFGCRTAQLSADMTDDCLLTHEARIKALQIDKKRFTSG